MINFDVDVLPQKLSNVREMFTLLRVEIPYMGDPVGDPTEYPLSLLIIFQSIQISENLPASLENPSRSEARLYSMLCEVGSDFRCLFLFRVL